MKNIWKNKWARIFVVVAVILAAFFIRSTLEKEEEKKVVTEEVDRDIDYAKTVEEDHPILKVFYEKYPQAQAILACEEDVTDDGNKDLIVIYKEGELIRTVVLIDSGDHVQYECSEPIPAPREHQKIQFKNIDEKAEIEMIITGEKNGAVGYAIYRIIDGDPVDLFGEGMEDCC